MKKGAWKKRIVQSMTDAGTQGDLYEATVDTLADILEENTQTIDRIIRLSADSTNAEYESAANREKLANARSVLGVYDEALTAQREAVQAYETLSASGKREYELAYGSSYNNLGNILHAAGNYSEASSDYKNAIHDLWVLSGF